MLNKLIIKNVALIECAEISFENRLNVLSGETGSGKSVIIDSLNFVLGAKADKSLIRSGENECVVTAEFDVFDNENIYKAYDDLEFEKDDLLIITRKFSVDGKSSIKLNGNSVTVGMLKKFTSNLVDVYGQSEHFDLLSNTNQLKLIDNYGGERVFLIKKKLNDFVAERKNIIKELELIGGDENQRLIKIDLLNYQINEIENSELKENEEQELKELKEKLVNQEKILNALNCIKNSISGEGGLSDIASNSVKVANSVVGFGEEFNNIYERLNGVYAELDDIAYTTDDIIDNFDYSELNIDDINSRLDFIKALKRKYGDNYSKIMLFLEQAIAERDKLVNAKQLAENLLIKKHDVEQRIYDVYNELDALRRVISKEFCFKITQELSNLGMNNARFEISFTDVGNIDECNFDNVASFNHVEFLFSANKGEQLKSLSSVISGGEMSRFMLALKSQTAKFNSISTFIFDEIDAGISGNAAKVVAEKFYDIAKDVQVVSISHLPQISAMADNNILIEKGEKDDRTVTKVKILSREDKVLEIVRLSGGEPNNSASIEHAKSIIQSANEYKTNKN